MADSKFFQAYKTARNERDAALAEVFNQLAENPASIAVGLAKGAGYINVAVDPEKVGYVDASHRLSGGLEPCDFKANSGYQNLVETLKDNHVRLGTVKPLHEVVDGSKRTKALIIGFSIKNEKKFNQRIEEQAQVSHDESSPAAGM